MTASAEPRTRREEVGDAIRQAIILGELQPGQKLREVALACDLGVSRPTLREALLGLVQEGLCEQEPHRGFSVARLDAQELRDLADTRLVLDRIAIEGIWADPSRLAEVDLAWAAYLTADNDPVAQHAAHVRLHQAIWEASHNSMLGRLWPVMESLAVLVLAQDQAARPDTGRAREVHGQLVEAIHSRDLTVVDAALLHHTRDSAEEFLALRGD